MCSLEASFLSLRGTADFLKSLQDHQSRRIISRVTYTPNINMYIYIYAHMYIYIHTFTHIHTRVGAPCIFAGCQCPDEQQHHNSQRQRKRSRTCSRMCRASPSHSSKYCNAADGGNAFGAPVGKFGCDRVCRLRLSYVNIYVCVCMCVCVHACVSLCTLFVPCKHLVGACLSKLHNSKFQKHGKNLTHDNSIHMCLHRGVMENLPALRMRKASR